MHCFNTSCTPSDGFATGVLLVSLSCLQRMLEAPPAHQVPPSFSAGRWLCQYKLWFDRQNWIGGKPPNQTGYVFLAETAIGFGIWFCNRSYFVVWSLRCLVFNTLSTSRTSCDPRNLRRLSTQASWWEGLLIFLYTKKGILAGCKCIDTLESTK